MHDDYDSNTDVAFSDAKQGLQCVLQDGGIDDPRHNPPAPITPLAWRNQPITDHEPVVVTNRKYFDSLLDDNNIKLNPDYYAWAPVSERLRKAFRDVYGKDGTITPLSRVTECQTAFIAVAGASLREWMDQTGRHNVANRKIYRELTQIVTWARIGDLKP